MYNTDEYRVSFNAYPIEGITSLQQLKERDRWTLQDIEAAESLIKAAKQYRIELAKRVQELATMQYHIKIELKREKRYNNKVYYYLTICKVFEDASTEVISNKKVDGKQRHEIIKEFEALKKQYPGAEFVKDIKKGRWE